METIANYREVKPVTPAAPYVGGKRLLAKRIIERIDDITHACYAEPISRGWRRI